jgi:hypothetical protein
VPGCGVGLFHVWDIALLSGLALIASSNDVHLPTEVVDKLRYHGLTSGDVSGFPSRSSHDPRQLLETEVVIYLR